MIRRSAIERPARRDRSEEFASWQPNRVARPVAAGSGLVSQALAAVTADQPPPVPTAAGRRHMGRVAQLGCLICRRLGQGPIPAEVHHLRTGQGAAQRASDWLVVPLCPACHRGPRGAHGDKGLLRQARTDEIGLLAETIALLSQQQHEGCAE